MNDFFINYGGPIFFGICIIISLFVTFHPTSKKPIYLNTSYDKRSDKSQLFLPVFKVDKIERTASETGEWVAKYTLHMWVQVNKYKNKKIEFVLYDEIGKYNIGDLIGLNIAK